MITQKLYTTLIIVVVVTLICNFVLLKKQKVGLRSMILQLSTITSLVVGFLLLMTYLYGVDTAFQSRDFTGIIAFLLCVPVCDLIIEIGRKRIKYIEKHGETLKLPFYLATSATVSFILPLFGFADIL